MANPIVYFEIAGKDKAALEDFYSAVFDWQVTPANDQYSHVSPGSGVNGGIGKSMDGGAGYVTFYVEVESIEDALTRVEGRGGQRVMGPQQMPERPADRSLHGSRRAGGRHGPGRIDAQGLRLFPDWLVTRPSSVPFHASQLAPRSRARIVVRRSKEPRR